MTSRCRVCSIERSPGLFALRAPHRIALLDQRVEHFEQFADILEMKPGRAAAPFLGELDALRPGRSALAHSYSVDSVVSVAVTSDILQ